MKSVLFGLLVLFILSQLLGFFAGSILFVDMQTNPIVREFFSVQQNQSDPAAALYIFVYTLIAALVVIFLIRYVRNDLIFIILEFGLISSASSIVFYSFVRLFMPYYESMGIGILAGLALAGLKVLLPRFKNPSAIFASAGAGAIFGTSLGLVPSFVFVALLAVYDYVAVFKTRHMVELADYMMKKNLSFMITSKKYIPELKKERRIDLGTGDMIMPIMLEVAVLPVSPIASLFVFIGAFLSLSVFLWLAMRKKMVLPALPPLAFGMILFFLIGKIAGAY